tara:strand:- start:1115 stop:1681 length:567 start_codon:yes stop_codon:yes gene_type:complete
MTVAALFLTAFLSTAVTDRCVDLCLHLTSKVFSRDKVGFMRLARSALPLAVLSAAVHAFSGYLTDVLALQWRETLTSRIHELYFSSMNYYHLANAPGRKAILDADERLAREVYSVSKRLAGIAATHFVSLPRILWFTYRLWQWRGSRYALLPHVWLLMAYEVAQRLFPKVTCCSWTLCDSYSVSCHFI